MMEQIGNPNQIKKIKKKKKKKYNYQAFIWIAPALVLLLVFCFYPPISAILMSFTNNGELQTKIVWFDNYIKIFKDPIFWKSMKNILILLAWGIIVGNIMPLLLAEMLYNLSNQKVSNILRFLFIIPSLVPGVVTMLLWQKIILSPTPTGLANSILKLFDLDPLGWYYDDIHKTVPLLSLLVTGFPWIGGTSFLIYMAGLQSIPVDVIEASKLDGISTGKRIIFIDIPFLAGQIKYFIIMGIIGGLQGYGVQVLFTKGGPNYETTVPGYYMYEKAFSYGEYGYASAVGMIIFIMTLSLTIINMKFINKKDNNR